MAVNDRLKLSVVGEQEGLNFINLFYYQVLAQGGQGNDMNELVTYWRDNVIGDMAEMFVDTYSITCLTVRILAPAMTATQTEFTTQAGNLPQDSLPSTCFAQLNYWAHPYSRGQRNHWKFGGLPEDANNRGLLSNIHVTRINTFVDDHLTTNIQSNGFEFQLIRAVTDDTPSGQPLPRVTRLRAKPQIGNTRSRQFRVCTG